MPISGTSSCWTAHGAKVASARTLRRCLPPRTDMSAAMSGSTTTSQPSISSRCTQVRIASATLSASTVFSCPGSVGRCRTSCAAATSSGVMLPCTLVVWPVTCSAVWFLASEETSRASSRTVWSAQTSCSCRSAALRAASQAVMASGTLSRSGYSYVQVARGPLVVPGRSARARSSARMVGRSTGLPQAVGRTTFPRCSKAVSKSVISFPSGLVRRRLRGGKARSSAA